MKTLRSLAIAALLFTGLTTQAQTNKIPVYAEAGIGFGQTLFFGDTRDNLRAALGGEFDPNIGSNLITGFYAAPERWRGFGLGARIKGTFGSGVKGKTDNDDYIFNYYNLGLHGKYYFSRQFNRGLFVRGGIGFGQITTKRANDDTRTYAHQYAIGSVLTGAAGYTFTLTDRLGLTLEAEFEYGSRNGTITGRGDGVRFQSGQAGINALITF